MKKTDKSMPFDNVTTELADQVGEVLRMADTHRYSVKRIYTLHNQVFGLRELHQTCSSCLRNRVANLRKWYAGYLEFVKPEQVAVTWAGIAATSHVEETEAKGGGFFSGTPAPMPDFLKPNPDDYETPDETGTPETPDGQWDAAYTLELQGGLFVLFQIDGTNAEKGKVKTNAEKGKVKTVDGKPVKPGKYTTSEGHEIAVQPGGKATLKINLL